MQKGLLLFIFLVQSIFALGQKMETNLSSFFTESEIRDLNSIADFLQKELCGTNDSQKFANCITNSIPDLVDLKQNYLQEKISWRKQKKLYDKIADSTFYKIWSLCDSWLQIEPEYKYKTICFSGNTDFIRFVDSLSETSPALEGYGKRLVGVGEFGYLNEILYNISSYPHQTNLDNRGVQILLAIHFLTDNDLAKRDKRANRLEKKYFRNFKKGRNKNLKTLPDTMYN